MPVLEYAATIWSPHTQRVINTIENVQRRVARFVFNDYSRYSSVTAVLSLSTVVLNSRD